MDIETMVYDERKIAVIRVKGALATTFVDTFRSRLASLLVPGKNVRHYVIDLSQVDFIDSSGFGALLSILKSVRGLGGDIKLAGLNHPGPRTLFEVTRARSIFEVYGSTQEALESW